MNHYGNIESLRKHVRIKQNKDLNGLKKSADKWLEVSAKNRIAYEIDWLGVPIIQTPEDMVLMQELIFKIQPDVIVETGVAHGGSLIYYASLLELLNKGTIIGIDVEIRPHNRKVIMAHPMFKRIELIEADSTSPETIDTVERMIPDGAKVIVCLDSDHTKAHVLKELKGYWQLVSPGSFIVVFDTHTSRMAEVGAADSMYKNNGPKEAISEFLETNDEFEIQKEYNKLFVSYSPDGYLRRKGK